MTNGFFLSRYSALFGSSHLPLEVFTPMRQAACMQAHIDNEEVSCWLMTTSEVAILLKVTRTSVRRYGAAGTLRSITIGSGQRLYSLADVERFLKERQYKRQSGGAKRRAKTDRPSTNEESL
jgi:excisionase family DNA binding protein